MNLERILSKGILETDLEVRSFLNSESPVPCSSDIRISPNQEEIPTIIIKQKKKKPTTNLKILWEFLQYKALNILFREYFEETGVISYVPKPLAVFPEDFALLTEFAPGFILKTLEKVETDYPANHFKGDNRIEYRVAYHLGFISGIKESNGIYHSDFDLRHVIYDPKRDSSALIDLENTRYLPNLRVIEDETKSMRKQWFEYAMKRGCSRKKLSPEFGKGKALAKQTKPKENYIELLKEVAEQYGLKIKPTPGKINKKSVKLNNPK
ncbi:hypothetical protein DRN73_05335 [Candidatus Pacearchaeota archaeon]|nr:MAG: hypothetical protein DRN73_05335 [Candidatus Pacearchaeota archaeon]